MNESDIREAFTDWADGLCKDATQRVAAPTGGEA